MGELPCEAEMKRQAPLLGVETASTSGFGDLLSGTGQKHHSRTDSVASKNATWFQAAHKGSRAGWGPHADTASRQFPGVT